MMATASRTPTILFSESGLPPAGIVSILHRMSGTLLFLIGISLLLETLAASLESPESYAEVNAVLESEFGNLHVPF
jgi:succinate dehydrogenase / fumarate reductase cytochrome b subunit